MATISKADRTTLETIVKATRSDGYTTIDPKKVAKLGAAGLVDIGAEVDGNNSLIYVKATDLGLAEFPIAANLPAVGSVDEAAVREFEGEQTMSATVENAETAVQAEKASRKPHVMVDASSISLGTGLPPSGKRGGGSGKRAIYPFDSLTAPVKDANGNVTSMSFFFVPASEGRDDPARALNSTVSSANKKAKAADVDPGTGVHPEYKVYAVEQNGVAGAAVYRTA